MQGNIVQNIFSNLQSIKQIPNGNDKDNIENNGFKFLLSESLENTDSNPEIDDKSNLLVTLKVLIDKILELNGQNADLKIEKTGMKEAKQKVVENDEEIASNEKEESGGKLLELLVNLLGIDKDKINTIIDEKLSSDNSNNKSEVVLNVENLLSNKQMNVDQEDILKLLAGTLKKSDIKNDNQQDAIADLIKKLSNKLNNLPNESIIKNENFKKNDSTSEKSANQEQILTEIKTLLDKDKNKLENKNLIYKQATDGNQSKNIPKITGIDKEVKNETLIKIPDIKLDTLLQNKADILNTETLIFKNDSKFKPVILENFSDNFDLILNSKVNNNENGVKSANMKSLSTLNLNSANKIDDLIKIIEIVKNGDTKKMTVKLEPDFLGKMNIHLTENAGKINAKIFVEQDVVKHFLMSNMDSIKQQLNEKGIVIDNMDFMFMGDYQNQQEFKEAKEQLAMAQKGLTKVEKIDDEVVADKSNGIYA